MSPVWWIVALVLCIASFGLFAWGLNMPRGRGRRIALVWCAVLLLSVLMALLTSGGGWGDSLGRGVTV